MNKMLATTAALLVAGFASAEVVSSNIVGYNTKSTTANTLDMFGVPFQTVGGSGTISIQDIKPVSGFGTEGGDLLRVWNPATQTYTTYGYFSSVYVGDTDVGAGWGDADQNKADITLTPGQGFWLKTANVASFTIAGEVVAKTANTITTTANTLTMGSNVFPVDASIQDLIPVSGFGTEGGDLLRVWNTATQGYTTYGYYSSVYEGDADAGAGWGDADQNKVTLTIAAGQGFWLKTVSAAVLSFNAPAGI